MARVEIVGTLWIDEKVGERRGRVGHVGNLRQGQQLHHKFVDSAAIRFIARVHTRKVGFIIDHEDRAPLEDV
ncbi:MAG: hypothetical protein C4344_06460 [Acidimicrobiia bacterium]